MRHIVFLFILLFFLLKGGDAFASMPIATDSRIRTFIYGENEVFSLRTKYGYQSNIEFSEKEEVLTISIGEASGWQITPSGRRLFIKAMEENAHTNMTVVTNKRVYQFELDSSEVEDESDLIYVIRFYYPDKDFDEPKKVSGVSDIAIRTSSSRQIMDRESGYNFNYSLTGPNDIAPLKVFDDGRFTYFEFPNRNSLIPTIYSISNKIETELVYRIVGNYVVVEAVERQFSLKHGRSTVSVFNDIKSLPES